MTDTQRAGQNKNTNMVGTVAAGMAGAAVIAGAAVAATIALKDEKTREKIKNVLIDAKDQAIDYADTFRTKSNAKKGSNAIEKIATNIKKAVTKSI
jgi:hypothetical protein